MISVIPAGGILLRVLPILKTPKIPYTAMVLKVMTRRMIAVIRFINEKCVMNGSEWERLQCSRRINKYK